MSIHTPDWVKDAIFYQIFPDRFAMSEHVPKPPHLEPWDDPPTIHGFKGGDLLGVLEHLDYLSDLGITAIYFNPIFCSTANHRYHTYDYLHVDPLLGGDNYVAWWNMPALPKLNTDNPEVREFLMEVAEYWIRQGIDGWRLDVPLEITTPGFWEEFRRRVKALNPEAYILGEIWDGAQAWLQGERFDAIMNYSFNRACYGFFGGQWLDVSQRPGGFSLERLDGVQFSQRIDYLLGLYDWQITSAQYNLLSSHDEPRFLTMVHGDTRMETRWAWRAAPTRTAAGASPGMRAAGIMPCAATSGDVSNCARTMWPCDAARTRPWLRTRAPMFSPVSMRGKSSWWPSMWGTRRRRSLWTLRGCCPRRLSSMRSGPTARSHPPRESFRLHCRRWMAVSSCGRPIGEVQ